MIYIKKEAQNIYYSITMRLWELNLKCFLIIFPIGVLLWMSFLDQNEIVFEKVNFFQVPCIPIYHSKKI